MVYWSFGDFGRVIWREDVILFLVFVLVFVYFIVKRWDLNVFVVGEEVVKSVGVEVERVCFVFIFFVVLIIVISVVFVGVIGFVGLIVLYFIRFIVGGDYRFLIFFLVFVGVLFFVMVDIVVRFVFVFIVFFVGIVILFFGVLVFIYFFVRMEG